MTADNSLFVGQLVVGNDGGRQGFLKNDGLIAPTGFLKKLRFNRITDS
jgi:hypothetical protein